MAYGFLNIASTPSVKSAQATQGSRVFWADFADYRVFKRFTARERESIAVRDSFYRASMLDNDWPYVQHRGGTTGLVKALYEHTFGVAEYRGNRQYISLGNIQSDGRMAPILFDHPRRLRLKLFAPVPKCVHSMPIRRSRLNLPCRVSSCIPNAFSCAAWKPSTGTARSTLRRAISRPSWKAVRRGCVIALPGSKRPTRLWPHASTGSRAPDRPFLTHRSGASHA